MSRPSSSDWRFPVRRTVKGALVATLPGGEVESAGRTLSAHVDTLGAMVKEIKDDGRAEADAHRRL